MKSELIRSGYRGVRVSKAWGVGQSGKLRVLGGGELGSPGPLGSWGPRESRGLGELGVPKLGFLESKI